LAANSVELAARSKGVRVTAEANLSCKILVNGEQVATAAGTLADLVEELGFHGVRIATARNGDFIPERLRAETALRGGDQIEIVTPRHGG
jgi:sulfur carrier protein